MGGDDDPGIGIVTIGDDDTSGGDVGETDDGSDGGSSDDGTAVRYCGDDSFTVAPLVPRVMLVLDKSHSMVDATWDHDADPSTAEVTRWFSLHETVSEVVRANDTIAELGAVLFPSRALVDNASATACEVASAPDVALGIDNADAIIDALPAADSLEIWGGTPTASGIAVAAEALRGVATDDPRAIILVTDGAANCSADAPSGEMFTRYDEDLAPLVAELAAEGIPTYVIGIDIVDAFLSVPAANPHDRLAEVAVAGGRPRAGDEPFFNTRSEAELSAALAEVSHALQCTLHVDALPDATERIHVAIGESDLAYAAACDADGWRRTDDGRIELCGNACADFVDGAAMHVAFDCVPEK